MWTVQRRLSGVWRFLLKRRRRWDGKGGRGGGRAAWRFVGGVGNLNIVILGF